jgi:hypothetical protein
MPTFESEERRQKGHRDVSTAHKPYMERERLKTIEGRNGYKRDMDQCRTIYRPAIREGRCIQLFEGSRYVEVLLTIRFN